MLAALWLLLLTATIAIAIEAVRLEYQVREQRKANESLRAAIAQREQELRAVMDQRDRLLVARETTSQPLRTWIAPAQSLRVH